ncbi:MAG: GNAT family N-acetyltransferase [Clostridia bacterium]|nr:GNAT family N-acetyltransferase [Clostridia bacterium]
MHVKLVPMDPPMTHAFYMGYERDPDLCMPGEECLPYVYSKDSVHRYIEYQLDMHRIPLAIMCDGQLVGEIILKNISPGESATLSITLQKPCYKDQGIGTKAEKLAVQYVFQNLDIPTCLADTILSNTRSQHVLEKVGFRMYKEDRDFRYYRIDREK